MSSPLRRCGVTCGRDAFRGLLPISSRSQKRTATRVLATPYCENEGRQHSRNDCTSPATDVSAQHGPRLATMLTRPCTTRS